MVEIYEKGWGHEEWIVNSDKYCGKILVLKKGKKCSVHYHKIKDETFHILSGLIILEVFPVSILNWIEITPEKSKYSLDELSLYLGDVKKIKMKKGDTFHLKPGLPHRFLGVDDESQILEVSTQHFEEDSYRVMPGDSQK